MIAAVHGGGGVPLTLAVLIAAAEWGCPPWEIAGGHKLTWLQRWSFWKDQQHKAAEVERKKARLKNSRR